MNAVLPPPSYEHAHTSTLLLMKQSLYAAPRSASKHTTPVVGGSPTAGCGVLSQPAAYVPHREYPGASVGMRVPAAPAKRYHCADERLVTPPIGCSLAL